MGTKSLEIYIRRISTQKAYIATIEALTAVNFKTRSSELCHHVVMWLYNSEDLKWKVYNFLNARLKY